MVFTPAANWHGIETFIYTVKDSHGGSDTASVTVTIRSINDLPVANDDTYDIDEDSAQADREFSVLSNDTDADLASGVDTETMTIVSVGSVDAAVCTVEIIESGTKVRINPIADWNGTTTFTYTIQDGDEQQSTATVTVNIAQVNDAPEAGNDTGSADEDHAAVIDVLENDKLIPIRKQISI